MLEDFEGENFSDSDVYGDLQDKMEKKLKCIHYFKQLTQNNVVAWHTLSCHMHRTHQNNLEATLHQTLNNVLGCKVILPPPVRRYKVYRSDDDASHIVIKHIFEYYQLAEALPPKADKLLPCASSLPTPTAQTPPSMTAVDNFADARNLSIYRESWSHAKITASMEFMIDLNQPDRAMVSPFDLHLALP
ncbi:hypothetical protein GCM10023116_16550 [Kistimonas scapharcae]|uniref:Uncharacterized protein n=2 Tax=Kistimonas scapharcae TaxID=1036133 RepID=A0ABP8V0T7_9GAMM